jgi:hypothetical protein
MNISYNKTDRQTILNTNTTKKMTHNDKFNYNHYIHFKFSFFNTVEKWEQRNPFL